MALHSIPEVGLSSGNGRKMPIFGLGTGTYPFPGPEVVVKAVLEAIELGYRMFDTASVYQTEEALGDAISQALSLGLIKSRGEVFITSKLWCTDNHGEHVLPALQKTLQYNKSHSLILTFETKAFTLHLQLIFFSFFAEI